jgi:hypothetical protein
MCPHSVSIGKDEKSMYKRDFPGYYQKREPNCKRDEIYKPSPK